MWKQRAQNWRLLRTINVRSHFTINRLLHVSLILKEKKNWLKCLFSHTVQALASIGSLGMNYTASTRHTNGWVLYTSPWVIQFKLQPRTSSFCKSFTSNWFQIKTVFDRTRILTKIGSIFHPYASVTTDVHFWPFVYQVKSESIIIWDLPNSDTVHHFKTRCVCARCVRSALLKHYINNWVIS